MFPDFGVPDVVETLMPKPVEGLSISDRYSPTNFNSGESPSMNTPVSFLITSKS